MTTNKDLQRDFNLSPLMCREIEGDEDDAYCAAREVKLREGEERPPTGGLGRKGLMWLLRHPRFVSIQPDGHGDIDVYFRR